jgi:hypothetical protein
MDRKVSERPTLTAYLINPKPPIAIVTAARGRAWMDATDQSFANRCLPLMMANQAGWQLLNPYAFQVVWTGQASKESILMSYAADVVEPLPASSHFGHGILTFQIPMLFRTSPGWHLMSKGPANLPKDGIVALEGITETDWSVATFTMNWQITRPNKTIAFAIGEPFAQLIPIRTRDLETFEPNLAPLESAPELETAYHTWRISRDKFNADLSVPGSTASTTKWQKHYIRGTSPTGDSAPKGEHMTNIRIREFAME